MKKGLLAIGVVAMALVMAVPAIAHAIQAEVRLAPVGRTLPPPPLARHQGWLTISNRDWQDYTLTLGKERLFLTKGAYGQNYSGGIVIPSAGSITIAVEKDNYRLYGNSDDRLKVRVREGRTTTVSLEPFGYVGNTGLMAVVNDGDRVRNEVIFDNYAPPVVVAQPTPVVVAPQPVVIRRRPPPPPPPVIINRPPVVITPAPVPVVRRPPPPPPPRHNDGWGFTFGFNKN